LAVLLIAGAALAAACGGAETVTVPQAREGTQEPVFYAHVASLKAAGDGFELELDPAWWLTGVTAMRAKLEDTGDDFGYWVRTDGDTVRSLDEQYQP
jgi:hypothetical protein